MSYLEVSENIERHLFETKSGCWVYNRDGTQIHQGRRKAWLDFTFKDLNSEIPHKFRAEFSLHDFDPMGGDGTFETGVYKLLLQTS